MNLDPSVIINLLLQKANGLLAKTATYNQFYVLSLHMRMVFFMSRRKFVESPTPQDLIQLVLGVRVAICKL